MKTISVFVKLRDQSHCIPRRAISYGMILLLVCGTACDTAAIRKLGAAVAAQAQLTCDKAISAYDHLDNWQARMEEEEIKLKLITHPLQDNLQITQVGTTVKRLELQIELRRQAYRALRNTYQAFNRLTDEAYAKSASEATSSLLGSINAIKQIPDIPEEPKGIVSRLVGEIVSQVQAKKIRQHNEQLSKLAEAYKVLWEADRPIWEKHLDDTSKIAASGIDGLLESLMNMERLNKIVNTPYVDSLNFRFYKQQGISSLHTERDKLKKEIGAVGKAFGLLADAHGELRKERPVFDNIVDFLTSIKNVLDPPN